MQKYLSLLAVAMLVSCSDAVSSSGAGASSAGGGQDGAGGSGSTSSTSSTGSTSSGSGGAGGADAGSGGAGGSAITSVKGESSTVNSCAPFDGPAFTIKIGLAEKMCSATAGGPLLSLSFWTHIDSPAGHSWSIPGANEAQGIYQPDGDPSNIVVVNSGTFMVGTWEMTAATGTYDVLLNDGTHLAGSFKAIGCLSDPVICK